MQDLVFKSFHIVEKNYKKYSVEDFTWDIDFINWVKRGRDKEKWEKFVLENPQLSKEIDIAKKVVTSLNFKVTEIDEASISAVYKNIEQYYSLHQRSARKVRFLKVMKYAAIFIVLISISTAIPYFYISQNDKQFSEFKIPAADMKEAKLTLSNGEEIALVKKHTDIQFNASGNQIRIDKDSTINYDTKTDQNAMAQIVVPSGMRSDILLSDGTKVWLNAGSRLIFPQKFSGKERKVFLKGEAYFSVAKNKGIPFIVSADKINVTVLGTEFNMKNNDSENELEVVLVEGSVSMKENSTINFLNKEIKLVPSQKATFNKLNQKIVVESGVDINYYTSWKEGLLEFKQESILNVFEKLSKFYNVRFVTEASVEMNRKISGKLDLKDSLEAVMKVIADAAPITYRIEGDKVMVNSKTETLPMR
jgi:transmembrane sensor